MKYEYLREFCDTDRQRAVLDAVRDGPRIKDAADALGVSERNLYKTLERLRQRAAKQGVAPETGVHRPAPVGYQVSRITDLQDGEGNSRLQWVQYKPEVEEKLQEHMNEMREAFIQSLPREKALKPGKAKNHDSLLNLHIFTDYHLGMYAWGEETGEDWDMKIAEDLLIRWFQYSIAQAPKASVGVLAQMGDLIHIDSFDAVTPTNKHLLDADGRFQKIIRIAIRALRRIIRMMLKKYDAVHIIMADANHDPASSAWLREVLHAFYEDEPRITVDRSPGTYYCYEHGDTSLFFHHGHKRKPANIDDVFTAKFRDVFGRTKRSYAHLGHLHHGEVKETNLMVVEQHRTMAAKDAYAANGGWLASRGAAVITYDKEFGYVSRFDVNPEMLERSC